MCWYMRHMEVNVKASRKSKNNITSCSTPLIYIRTDKGPKTDLHEMLKFKNLSEILKLVFIIGFYAAIIF